MAQPLLVIRVTVATLVAASALTAWPVVDSAPAATPRPISPSVERASIADQRAEAWSGGDPLHDDRPNPTRKAGPQAADQRGDSTGGRDAGSGGARADDDTRTTSEQLVTVGGSASLVGVTWSAATAPPAGTPLAIRGHGANGWTTWVQTSVSAETDPAAARAGRTPRAGTEPVWLGAVNRMQVRYLAADAGAVRGGRLELVEPGRSRADAPPSRPAAAANAAAAEPEIVSRADWGADESLRNCDVEYAPTARAMALHHTAGSNSYSASESAAIVRGVYAYHTNGQDWCDVGYNALVDRYGRIFEGRAGGLDRPVIGSHAGGFNTGTFGVSIMGTHETVPATPAALAAVQRIMAWRSSMFYTPADGSVTLTSRGSSRHPEGAAVTLPVLFGHRDVSLTACPGGWLSSRLPSIRTETAALASYRASPVYRRWAGLGGASSFLGSPRQGEKPTPFGVRTIFQEGRALWSTSTSVWYLGPGINLYYEANDGARAWGALASSERQVTGGFRADLASGRALLWSSRGGVSTNGAIRALWDATGAGSGPLGWPTGEIWQPTEAGWVQGYSGAVAYYSPEHGAYRTSGPVATKHWQLGGPDGRWGYPVGAAERTAGGLTQPFDGGGIHLRDGAATAIGTSGPIHLAYAAQGGPASDLGYPTTEATADDADTLQTFQGGRIHWDRATGEVDIRAW
ncbi:MAG: N-acetylmuramoyl-L-alanine amidase [Dermatophilaceae bacterium]